MTRRVEVAPRALAEAEAAAVWYEEFRPGYGRMFRRELDAVLLRLRENPTGFQAVNPLYRRAFLRRFPFVVVCRVRPDRVEIVGVLPTKADPALLAMLTQAPFVTP
ncbi:MAG: type II toxin-antitoxin system RelE/ParE family toxin [Phycisphaerales bacterium]|nr:type II toxin-antitoxin system RelE/ParE family toxin [Phycisphaerales bacterium]